MWHIDGMLDDFMQKTGHTDASLAKAVGVSRPYIWRIRHGKRHPSLAVAVKLAEITALPVEGFVRPEAA